jgi:hypothetical protein
MNIVVDKFATVITLQKHTYHIHLQTYHCVNSISTSVICVNTLVVVKTAMKTFLILIT